MNFRRRFAFVIAALLGLPLAVVLVIVAAATVAAMAGVSIDASPWRDAVAQRAAAAIGRPVVLRGAMVLTLGREPGLRIGNVQILNPPGFTGQQFMTIGELRARVDLFDVLRGRLRLRSVEASDVGVWLERAADGRGNWAPSAPRDPGPSRAGVDIDRLQLQRLGIHYHDPRSATRRAVDLDELYGSAGRDQPLRLAVRAGADLQHAYSLRIEGGPLRLLQDDAEPWPVTLDFKTRGARLHASGTVDTRQGTARLQVSAHADDLAPIERLLGQKLPGIGGATLNGSVHASTQEVRITELNGWWGGSEFSGQLALAFGSAGSARPRLSGALSAATLDLRPLLAAPSLAQGDPPDSDTSARQSLPLRDLSAVDVELDVNVERCLGLPVDLRDANFKLRADKQGLRVPMRLTMAGVPFAGSLDLDTATPLPTLALQLSADDAVLGELAQSLGYASGIEGTLGRLAVGVGGRGETLAALLRDLELAAEATAARLRFDPAGGGRPVAVSLDTLKLALRRGERLRGSARGSLLGERASLSFRGGTLPEMLGGQAMPLDLDLALGPARLRADGRLALAGSTRDTALRFDLRAPRAGDLARWLDVAPESKLPVALQGQLRISDQAWALEQTTLEIGRSVLQVDARRALTEGRPLITAAVRSPLIDVPALLTLRAAPRSAARGSAPVFPAAFEWADADVDLRLQQVLLARTELTNLSLVARTREGRSLPASATGQLAGAPFSAYIDLDLQGELPSAKLDLSAGAIDFGKLLRGLGVADDIDGRAQSLQLSLQGRGNSLDELLAHSAIDLRLSGGHLTVRGAAERPVAEIRLDNARIGAPAGEPLRLRLDGALDQTPVRIDLRSGTLADFARDATRMPFALQAQAAGTRLALTGEVTLPLGSGGQLVFEMDGQRLDTFSELARVELPAWGPWSIRAPIRMTPTGYELQDLDMVVGRSQLRGDGKLDLSGPRPYLALQVAAPSIQIDDFPWPQGLSEPPAQPDDGGGLRRSASRLAGRTDSLLSAGFLRRFDATIDVKAKEVFSGSDRLADGALYLQLRDGRLHLDPAVVNLPGGTMRLSMSYDLKGSEVEFAASALVERFDYGIIARRLGRAQDLRGLFSLDLKLEGTAPSLDAIMRNANGRVDIAVWPTELRSGVFNLWSVNLVLQLLPLINPGAQTQVNCVVGRFDLADGDLVDDKILIDTTTVRILGTGHANLQTEELEFVFRPRAKGLAVFRLQTPLRVTGDLGSQNFGFEQSDVLESVLRLIAAPILWPIDRIRLGPLPRDGADVCTNPLRALAP